ncbi:S1C family serine protease [Streptomyces sp. KL118A]|uniref:S1C family serine protease n=1 Tax=Streptomyces sp. KL118A TaxID=3045153 RepID=UPI00278BB39F|nr:trypsin-like peptidase domain-containing protein [Streptomyces sp. KL118A]
MDDGKPTKANWWSRPRPEERGVPDEASVPPLDPAQSPATPQPPTGLPPAQAPAGRAPQDAAPPAPDTPAHPTEFPSAQVPASPAPQDGDTPASTSEFPSAQAPVAPAPQDVPSTGADAPAATAEFPSAPVADQAPQGVTSGGPIPGADVPSAQVPAQGPGPTERPRPLHDPDPYGTPPYGEPGPWAPAPPVQHPAATPAHGTPLSAVPHGGGTPPHGTPGPAHGTPPQGTQGPAHPSLAHAPQGGGTPPHGTPGPAHGTPPQGTPGSAHPSLAHAPQGGGTPAHGTPGPAPHPPQHPQPQSQPQSHAPQPQPQQQPHPQVPQAAHAAQGMASPPVQAGGSQVASRQPYDPWNAPLQQVGSLPPETREKRDKRGRRVLFIGVAVIALLSGLIGGATGAYLERNGTGDVELRQADAESADRPKGSVAGIASATLPGVVTLHVSGDSAQGTGTGFVLDGKGHILTNNHVVEPAGTGGEVSVTFSGGETAKAEVVGRDSGYDLAVVRVTGVRGLKPLPLGNSENVQVGDSVVAIGAPFDLENTVTSGIISAKERPITAGGEKGDGSDISYVDALQTDAPINPGNSGGPLVDSKARVIGINSAIRSADDGSDPGGGQAGSIGLGFAIPINQGKRVAEELINFGKATHPVIGVTLDTEFNGDGARIADKGRSGGPSVNRNGPGDKAGLKPGDVITEVDGRAVHSSDELIVKVRAHRPKDRLRLTVERDGNDREVTLVLGSAGGD